MFKNIFIKIKKASKLKSCCSPKFIFTVFFSFVFLFIVAVPVHAGLGGVGKAIVIGLGWVAYGFAWVVGEIMVLVVDVLVKVASVNNFINVPVVKTGWVIVRDLSNMFFILILLIIAFATILRIESYSMKRWLPKLLIMAVLINFSKTICGLIIDFSQVIMLTFVSGFSAHGSANLIDLFKVKDYLSFSNITDEEIGTLAVMGGIVAGLIAFIVTLIILLVMLAILIMRIILLWIYVILSPIAFLASSFPAGQRYSSQWWNEFVKQVIVGPVLAFFLWLALTTAQQSSSIFEKVDISGNASVNGASTNFCAGAGASLLCSARFIEYIVVIGLLVGGLIVTQQVGAAAGAAAGRGIAAIKKGQAIGVRGVRRATGYEYVSGVAKNYLAMRKSDREEKVRLAAGKLAQGIGRAKETTVGAVGRWGNRQLGRFGRNQADAIERALNNRQEFTHRGHTYRYNSNNNRWEVFDRNNQPVIGDNGQQIRYEHRALRAEMAPEINRLRSRQRWAERGMMVGLAGGIGMATGGIGLNGLLLGAAGAFGARNLARRIRDAGQTDLNLVSNYNLKQIREAKEKLHNEDDRSIMDAISDPARDAFERAGAVMIALERKLFSDLSDVTHTVAQLPRSVGGRGGRDNWSDRHVEALFDAAISKHYPAAGGRFAQRLAEKQQGPGVGFGGENYRAVVEAFRRGDVKLSDIDNQSIREFNEEFIRGMRPARVVKQYNSIREIDEVKAENIRDAVTEALNHHDPETRRNAQQVFLRIGTAQAIRNWFTQHRYENEFQADMRELVRTLDFDSINEMLKRGDNRIVRTFADIISDHSDSLSEAIRNRFLNPDDRVAQSTFGALYGPNDNPQQRFGHGNIVGPDGNPIT